MDRLLPCPFGQRLQQHAGQTASPPLLGDHERRLGDPWGRPHVARHSDSVPADGVDGHDCLMRMVVDAGEIVELAQAEPRLGAEVSAVLRFRTEPDVRRGEQCAVVGFDRPHDDLRPVRERHAPFTCHAAVPSLPAAHVR